jgi:hypothetical protein
MKDIKYIKKVVRDIARKQKALNILNHELYFKLQTICPHNEGVVNSHSSRKWMVCEICTKTMGKKCTKSSTGMCEYKEKGLASQHALCIHCGVMYED